MSRRGRLATPESFERELDRLRLKIDSLPVEQRPHLVALADTIKQQNRRLKTHEYKDQASS